ncbi:MULTISPECIES: hypothetical protein [unclassified Dehalobacter]|uniref:hypothetical protein n=1 Tax=unclassified Dehalobacter TaxID=2635733 RepID=UPI0009FEB21C|nr:MULTISPECIES: hypothetical protein [unclassified Dehalobacter]RJE49008.1 hypothetical protein A7K50_07815 [Dehalobacter sp. MCB1]TCX51748.1 hypothetical protein C1I36_05335 [Dehalobacter sp. 14DCB1]TCX52808.1 hypothetical protein C1I38_07015 [Dehalobacter sp. 12DCB1]
MDHQYCPRCQLLQPMALTETVREEKNGDRTVKIKTISYSCTACNTFVQSEDVVMPAKGEKA